MALFKQGYNNCQTYLSSDGTLFSKYTSTRHGSTRTTTYNFKTNAQLFINRIHKDSLYDIVIIRLII